MVANGCTRTAPVRYGFVRPRAVAARFDPALAPALLEGPARDRWQRPETLVDRLALRRGDVVADIGAGSGYLLRHLSRAVGKEGVVLAEEVQESFLPDLERRARALGNVVPVLGRFADPLLPRRDVSLFVLLTVYHEVERPVDFLKTLARYARPGARLAIIDFDPDRHGDPPPPVGHAVKERDVLDETRAAGWRLVRRHDLVPSQFFLVFGR